MSNSLTFSRTHEPLLIASCVLLMLWTASAAGADFKREEIDPSYRHDRFATETKDIVRTFRAYATSFDSDDDDDRDGRPDIWGIPHFVAYEMRLFDGKLPAGPKRPSPWITDPALFAAGIAPSDATYHYPEEFRRQNQNWYVRGHLCMKQHAWRLGAAADWNTHTVLNAVPQRDDFNSGIWQDLEDRTAEWADEYGAVWIIDGPIFNRPLKPSKWLGEDDEMKIAIPDSLFKIVIKESENPDRPDVLAFIYPQAGRSYRKGPFDHTRFLKPVAQIEELTGLRFFTSLPAADQQAIKHAQPTELWD